MNDDHLRELLDDGRDLARRGYSIAGELVATIEQLQAEREAAFNEGYELAEQETALSDLSDCPHYVGTGTCSYGCQDEPACQTGCPRDGWPTEQHPLVVKLKADNARLTAALADDGFRCDNCGKTMAEHGPLANCWPLTQTGDDT